jgi:hypothetical protein
VGLWLLFIPAGSARGREEFSHAISLGVRERYIWMPSGCLSISDREAKSQVHQVKDTSQAGLLAMLVLLTCLP